MDKILLLTAAALMCACSQPKDTAAQSIPPTPAQLVKAQSKEVREYISTMGTISSRESVNIVPEVSGKIISVDFAQGAKVKKGDVLAVIDPRTYKAALLQAQGALRQAFPPAQQQACKGRLC